MQQSMQAVVLMVTLCTAGKMGLIGVLGVQNIMHSCSIPVCSEVPEFEVYIEDLKHAVARVRTPRLVHEPAITEMRVVPPELASLYMDPQLQRS